MSRIELDCGWIAVGLYVEMGVVYKCVDLDMKKESRYAIHPGPTINVEKQIDKQTNRQTKIRFYLDIK